MNNNKYFLAHIKTYYEFESTDFEKAIDELKSNPTYYFTWRAEDIIKSGYKKQFYEKLINDANDEHDIRINIIRLVKFLIMLDETFRAPRSTCLFQLQEYVLQKEARIELIERLESLIINK